MGEYADMEINAALDDVWDTTDVLAPHIAELEQQIERTHDAERLTAADYGTVINATGSSLKPPTPPRFTMFDPSPLGPLLDCPPCGSDMVEILSMTDGPFSGYCHQCCGEGPPMPTIEEAVQAWNEMERGAEVQRRAYNEIVMLARQPEDEST